jgi:dienelactone hydrolase
VAVLQWLETFESSFKSLDFFQIMVIHTKRHSNTAFECNPLIFHLAFGMMQETGLLLIGVTVMFARLIPVVLFGLLTSCAGGQRVVDLSQGQSGWLSYPSSAEKLALRGELQFPNVTASKLPAVVIAHGSGGLDERSERWAKFFREKGIATFKIDYFGPRWVTANSSTQPLPTNDTIDALNLLSSHPRIDPSRIAIIGFSRGAHLAINSASPGYTGSNNKYAAHVGLYPICGLTHIGKGDTSNPIMILVGSDDDIAPVVQCEILQADGIAKGRSVTLRIYEGAQHGWDGDYTGVWFHNALNTSYRLRVDIGLTERSQSDVLEFLKFPLKL